MKMYRVLLWDTRKPFGLDIDFLFMERTDECKLFRCLMRNISELENNVPCLVGHLSRVGKLSTDIICPASLKLIKNGMENREGENKTKQQPPSISAYPPRDRRPTHCRPAN